MNKPTEVYYGRDIRAAYPKEEFNIEPLEPHIEPDQLYYIREYKYQSNTVEFGPVKIWKQGPELAADCERLGVTTKDLAAEVERVNDVLRCGLATVRERVLRDYPIDKEANDQCNSKT